MSEHIQPLLERIQSEGLKKSETERDQILSDANAKAAAILADASAQAEKIKTDAAAQAKAQINQGTTALEQAARDLLLKLRTEIARQLNIASEKAASATLSSEEAIAALLPVLVKSGSGNVTVETGSDLAEKLSTLLPSLLKDAGKDGRVVMNPKTGAGFQLRFEDSAGSIDVTSQALADWLSQNLRPELAALLRPQADGE